MSYPLPYTIDKSVASRQTSIQKKKPKTLVPDRCNKKWLTSSKHCQMEQQAKSYYTNFRLFKNIFKF